MGQKYRLEVSYPAREHYPLYDDLIKRIADGWWDESGIGFGLRDVVFQCNSQEDAESLSRRIKSALKDVTTTIMEPL